MMTTQGTQNNAGTQNSNAVTQSNGIRIGSIVTVIPVEEDFAPHGNALHQVVDVRKPRGSAPIWRISPITERGLGDAFAVYQR